MSFLFDQLKPTLASLEQSAKADGNDLAAEAFAKLLKQPDPLGNDLVAEAFAKLLKQPGSLKQQTLEAFVNLTPPVEAALVVIGI